MGYIFDAMNRAGDDAAPHREDKRPDASLPVEPVDAEPLPFRSDAAELQKPQPVDEADDAVLAELTPLTDTQPAEPRHEAEAEAQEADETEDLEPASLEQVDDRLVVLTDPGSVMAEEYRATRTSMLARWKHKRHLVHTITSATPQEGKTITSLNLGLSFAELRNRKTVVVECDLRLPTMAKLLRMASPPGLTGYLNGDLSLQEITHELGETGLHVIPAGGRANNDAVQMLSSQRMTQLLEALRAKYDHVIVDTPPVVELADAGIIGAQSDDVLLIARMNRTPRALIEQAVRTLASYNAPVAGMIATDQKRIQRRYYYYRYGYTYRYQTRKAA